MNQPPMGPPDPNQPPAFPGYQPPPGYPAFPQGNPSAGYAPAGPVIQPVPPASGSLMQAWLSVATKLTRANIASWAQITTNEWVTISIVVSTVLYALYGAAIALAIQNILPQIVAANATATGVPATTFTNVYTIEGIAYGAFVPLVFVAEALFYPLMLALFMPDTYGTVRQRFARAIKPWALTLPAITVVGLVLGAIVVALIFTAGPVISSAALNPNTPPPALGTLLALFLLVSVLSIPAVVYTYALVLQSGSVGSDKSRWVALGAYLLAGLCAGFITWMITFIGLIVSGAALRVIP